MKLTNFLQIDYYVDSDLAGLWNYENSMDLTSV